MAARYGYREISYQHYFVTLVRDEEEEDEVAVFSDFSAGGPIRPGIDVELRADVEVRLPVEERSVRV